MAFPRLRARGGEDGGRGPQIADGTFEGSVGPIAGFRPYPFTFIAWAPASPPSVELWCILTSSFQPVDPSQARGGLFLERVESGEFSPSSGGAPDSQATQDELKAYARERFLVSSPPGTTNQLSDWTVNVVRPFNYPIASQPSIERIRRTYAFAVYQNLVPAAQALTAYVWVPLASNTGGGGLALPAREIWLHYRPDLPGGFVPAGATPVGATTPMHRARYHFAPMAGVDTSSWSLDDLPTTIAAFKLAAIGHPDAPTYDVNDLGVTDFRVSGPA